MKISELLLKVQMDQTEVAEEIRGKLVVLFFQPSVVHTPHPQYPEQPGRNHSIKPKLATSAAFLSSRRRFPEAM
jgi:hypothetical protein